MPKPEVKICLVCLRNSRKASVTIRKCVNERREEMRTETRREQVV